MCLRGPKLPTAAAPMLIPAANNGEAEREADMQAALMRRRRGAAANILTGPGGIPNRPAAAQLGGVAA